MYGVKYDIDTKIEGTDIIQTTTELINGGNRNIVERVVDTQDFKIREALIKLGWTPPNDE